MRTIEHNILTVNTNSVICHQVNCLGIMGAGIALQIRKKWPHVYNAYKNKYNWQLGDCQFVNATPKENCNIFIANLAGQQNIGKGCQTNYNALCKAFRQAYKFSKENELQLYIPYMMGCGFAGGKWDILVPMLEDIAPETIICKLPYLVKKSNK